MTLMDVLPSGPSLLMEVFPSGPSLLMDVFPSGPSLLMDAFPMHGPAAARVEANCDKFINHENNTREMRDTKLLLPKPPWLGNLSIELEVSMWEIQWEYTVYIQYIEINTTLCFTI